MKVDRKNNGKAGEKKVAVIPHAGICAVGCPIKRASPYRNP